MIGMWESPVVRFRFVIIAVVLMIAAVGVIVLLGQDNTEAQPPCGQIGVSFETDDAMQEAAGRLRAEQDIAEVITETKQQSFKEYQSIFANYPEMLKIARPEGMPAWVKVKPAAQVNRLTLMDTLRTTFPEGRVTDLCLPVSPAAWSL
jgi:cell division protein FtsX